MKTNEAAKAIIKHAEGLKLDSYKCPAGVWTIGYGHTGADVCEGLTISDDGADVLLSADLAWAERVVAGSVSVPLTANQFSALVSFVFNVGPGRADKPGQPGKDGFVTLRNGQPSTMRRKLNAGDYAGAADEFPRWTSGGMPGLITRRAAERALFLTPDSVEA